MVRLDKIWSVLRSPKTIALLNMGAATLALVHAVDQFVNSSRSSEKIGFKKEH